MSSQSSSVSDMIRKSWEQDNPSGWFEPLYASAHNGEGRVPWAYLQPTPDIMHWLDENQLDATGKSALVVGCGLGDDAEGLQQHGFDVTAFDVSETAILWCKERFPDSEVDYQVADLLNPPDVWKHKFDFVLEHRTVQALPYQYAAQAIQQIASFVAPDGTALVLCHGRDEDEDPKGIPWPLSRNDLHHFEAAGLTEIDFKDYSKNGLRRFLVEYRR